jgi:hypothetical protein
MRLLGVLVVAVIMYLAVPILWGHAMVRKVNALQGERSPFPVSASPIASVDTSNLVAAMHPPLVIDTEKYERIAIQDQGHEAAHQARAAQDMTARGYDPTRN